MLLVGDVKCYYCGFISGELVSANSSSLKNATFRPRPGVDQAEVDQGKLRCVRCGGPVFVDDLRHERPAAPPVKWERERPGRPRRVRTEGSENPRRVKSG
jgi:hypothetical protein